MLPLGPAPRGGYPLAVILTHGSKGDLASAELPTYAVAAAAAGAPCLRFTYRPEDAAARAVVMQEVMLRATAGKVHPALAGVTRWVVGGRSLGARAAAKAAAAVAAANAGAGSAVPGRRARRASVNSGAGASGTSSSGGAGAGGSEDLARRIREAGEKVEGVVLSAYPVHPLGEPDHLYDQPVGSLQLPIIFLRGTADPYSEEDRWRLLRSRVISKDVDVCNLEGADHLMQLPGGEGAQGKARDQLAAALHAFVRGRIERAAEDGGSGAGPDLRPEP